MVSTLEVATIRLHDCQIPRRGALGASGIHLEPDVLLITESVQELHHSHVQPWLGYVIAEGSIQVFVGNQALGTFSCSNIQVFAMEDDGLDVVGWVFAEAGVMNCVMQLCECDKGLASRFLEPGFKGYTPLLNSIGVVVEADLGDIAQFLGIPLVSLTEQARLHVLMQEHYVHQGSLDTETVCEAEHVVVHLMGVLYFNWWDVMVRFEVANVTGAELQLSSNGALQGFTQWARGSRQSRGSQVTANSGNGCSHGCLHNLLQLITGDCLQGHVRRRWVRAFDFFCCLGWSGSSCWGR